MPEGWVISKPDEWSWKIVGSYLGAGEDFPPRSIRAIDHAKKHYGCSCIEKRLPMYLSRVNLGK